MKDDLARPLVSGISHLGLSVTDLDRSIAFYRDVLGAVLVRAPYDGDNPSFSGHLALIKLGPLGIDLYQHAATRDESFDPAQSVSIILRSLPQRGKSLKRGHAGWTNTMLRARRSGTPMTSPRCLISRTPMESKSSSSTLTKTRSAAPPSTRQRRR
jgi:catechol 2,3-dioxygenase-like lactoylglutathione lyase family enzyme